MTGNNVENSVALNFGSDDKSISGPRSYDDDSKNKHDWSFFKRLFNARQELRAVFLKDETGFKAKFLTISKAQILYDEYLRKSWGVQIEQTTSVYMTDGKFTNVLETLLLDIKDNYRVGKRGKIAFPEVSPHSKDVAKDTGIIHTYITRRHPYIVIGVFPQDSIDNDGYSAGTEIVQNLRT